MSIIEELRNEEHKSLNSMRSDPDMGDAFEGN